MAERVFGGRYRVTGTLGHGGMASVYRAVDEQLGREVAVKVFRMGAVDHGERARAEAEIQVLAGLRSPALVTLYDAALDDADGDSYLVMELVPGSDLATRLREGPLDRPTTARVGAQVADGLAAVHVQGIVHRDVKPANVLLESDGTHVKLADFGIALLRDAARVTGTGTVMGTAAYLAPEQVTAQGISGKSDVYSLGLVLLECLSGRMPFPGSAVESATARLTRAPEIDASLPTAWRVLLHVMTAMDPAERPTAAEAAERLRALSYDDGAPATQLLPGGPGTLTPAAAAAGAAGATAVLGTPASASADQPTQAMAADQPTRAMPAARPQDDATRVLPAGGASRQDDVATTVLGAQRGGGTSGGGGAPVAPRAPQADPPEERKRRTGQIVTLVIVGVLVLAGIVWAVVALGGGSGDGGTTPAPTNSSTPGQQEQQPSDEPSQEQQPSQPEQPSQPAEPSEPEQQPSDEPSQPTAPSNGPEPSVEPTLPVQTPVGNTGAGKGPGSNAGPGNSGNAPGHNKG
ncbi:serine/threonine-protein kinase [Curtobacterium sp. VKM Ac-2922]|uniref:serine/threonine-protein kinase n=1 Tax=Curtobacterium sp. VKM Ac-2922 TaxID=2929475 RepID=UPI001FB53446|nr:serine/threonine-protein kinase [Curtobacterium sp. VKM Ac-2922]MCJ1712739.1 protein kinase [Curtobacterium sp. VKM Ac-2922]